MATTTEDTTRPRAFSPDMADRLGTSTRTPGWDLATERRIDDGETLARMLGWCSIALGAAEVAMPRRISRYLGMRKKGQLVRLYGLREIASGVGILSQRKPEPWIWGRIAGDALDLATLAMALRPRNQHRDHVWAAVGMVAGITALDVLCARQLAENQH